MAQTNILLLKSNKKPIKKCCINKILLLQFVDSYSRYFILQNSEKTNISYYKIVKNKYI